MHSHFVKSPASNDCKNYDHYPKVNCHMPMLWNPSSVDKTISVSIDNIIHWIKFKYTHYPCRHNAFIPHNWGQPHSKLRSNIDNLSHIPEKRCHRRCKISLCQHKTNFAKHIIEHLNHCYSRCPAGYHKNNKS